MGAPVVASSGIALAGAGFQAYATREASLANAKIAENNAQLAEYQGIDALRRGAQAAGTAVSAGRRATARGIAAMGAQGVETTVGSPAAILAANEAEAAADAARIRDNAAREAWGYQSEAEGLHVEAQNIRRAGVLGAVGAGFQGASSVLQGFR